MIQVSADLPQVLFRENPAVAVVEVVDGSLHGEHTFVQPSSPGDTSQRNMLGKPASKAVVGGATQPSR
jgi:hypothetical protein